MVRVWVGAGCVVLVVLVVMVWVGGCGFDLVVGSLMCLPVGFSV